MLQRVAQLPECVQRSNCNGELCIEILFFRRKPPARDGLRSSQARPKWGTRVKRTERDSQRVEDCHENGMMRREARKQNKSFSFSSLGFFEIFNFSALMERLACACVRCHLWRTCEPMPTNVCASERLRTRLVSFASASLSASSCARPMHVLSSRHERVD